MTSAWRIPVAVALVLCACASPGALSRDAGGDPGPADVADARDPGGGRDAPDESSWPDPGPDGGVPDAAVDAAEDPAPDPDPALTDVPDEAPADDAGWTDTSEGLAPVDPGPDAGDPSPVDPGPVVPPPPTRDDVRRAARDCTDSLALAAFLRDRYDGPVCDDAGCTMVTVVAGTTASLRGEFNAWGDTPLAPVGCKAGAFWGEVGPVPAAADAWQYRLGVDGTWADDPLNRWIRFTDVSINNAMHRDGTPRIARLSGVHSAQLDNDRDVYVYVPAEAFPDTGRRFPIVVMQDGWNVFDNPQAPFGSWKVDGTARALAAAGAIEPVILAGVTTADRIDEYLYTDFWVNGLGDPILVDPKLPAYAAFLVDTLLPRLRAEFPARTGPADTAVAGSSLGGISSFWIAWNHADVFGKVAALSPSFWVGEAGSGTEEKPSMREVMGGAAPTAAQRALKIYFDSGDGGYSPGGGSDPAYALDGHAYTDWTRNLLVRLGWPNRPEWDTDADPATPPDDLPLTSDPATVPALEWSATVPAAYADWDAYLRPDLSLLCLLGVGQVHNEGAWAQRFPAVLRFLFPAR